MFPGLLSKDVIEIGKPNGWIVFGTTLTAVVSALGLATKMWRDRRIDRRSETKLSVDYVKQALGGFEELVDGLREEVSRLRDQRDQELKRYRETESKLTQEIIRLRAEVTVLRQLLSNHRIIVPVDRPALEGEGA